MDARRRERVRSKRPVTNAQERWKDQWGVVMRRSALAAVALHLAVFAVWPAYQVAHDDADPYWAAAHLIRVALPDLLDDQPKRTPATLPEEVRERRSAETETPDVDAFLQSFAPPLPALAGNGHAFGAPLRPQFAAYTGTITGPRPDLRIDPALVQRSFTWPEILNPREMIRFLRSRYNPIHTQTEADRFVSVAIWINEQGSVEWCEVHESSGHPAMDEIALTAVNDVLAFSPAQREGLPVAVAVVLSIPFQVQW